MQVATDHKGGIRVRIDSRVQAAELCSPWMVAEFTHHTSTAKHAPSGSAACLNDKIRREVLSLSERCHVHHYLYRDT